MQVPPATGVPDGVQTELQPLRDDVTRLAADVRALQAGANNVTTRRPTRDANDPARRRVAFLGFPGDVSPELRLVKLQQYLDQLPAPKPLAVCNRYNGPRNQRTCTKNAYAEFCDQDARDLFLQAVDGLKPLKVNGTTVRVKKAKTAFNESRDWALHKAKDLLSTAAPQRAVALHYDSRSVTVDNVTAFRQEEHDPRGAFCAPFLELQLPN